MKKHLLLIPGLIILPIILLAGCGSNPTAGPVIESTSQISQEESTAPSPYGMVGEGFDRPSYDGKSPTTRPTALVTSEFRITGFT